MVRPDKLAAARGDQVERAVPGECSQTGKGRDAGDHVIPRWLGPSLGEIGVVDEHVGRVRSGSTVFEVLESAVEQCDRHRIVAGSRRQRGSGYSCC